MKRFYLVRSVRSSEKRPQDFGAFVGQPHRLRRYQKSCPPNLSYNCPLLDLKRPWFRHNVNVDLEKGGSRLCSPHSTFSPAILIDGMQCGLRRVKAWRLRTKRCFRSPQKNRGHIVCSTTIPKHAWHQLTLPRFRYRATVSVKVRLLKT